MHTGSSHFSFLARAFSFWYARARCHNVAVHSANPQSLQPDLMRIKPLAHVDGLANAQENNVAMVSPLFEPVITGSVSRTSVERKTCIHPVAAAHTRPRAVRTLRARDGTTDRLALVGRMADVCAELERLAARERLC